MDKQIISLFTKSKELEFNQIEKQIDIRSNKLAYHIKKLIQSGILIKIGEKYRLADSKEHLIPYISEKSAVLPVVLIHIGNNKEAYLVKRSKRPYMDKLGLPGGRIIIGESILNSAKRIMLEKYNIKINKTKIENIFHEHLIRNNTINSFIIFLVKAKANCTLTNIKKNQKELVHSDYKMINSKKTNDIIEIKSKIKF